MASHPFAGILALIETEFECTAARDTAELAGRKFGVALKLQPIHTAVLAAVCMHGVQQHLAIQTFEAIRAEALSKKRVTFGQAFFRQQFTAFKKRFVARPQGLLDAHIQCAGRGGCGLVCLLHISRCPNEFSTLPEWFGLSGLCSYQTVLSGLLACAMEKGERLNNRG